MSRRYAEGFESVLDFRKPRPWGLALLFYLIHFLVMIFISMIVGEVLSIVLGGANIEYVRNLSVPVGRGWAIIYSSTIYGLIIYYRKSWKNPWYILGFAATVGLAYYKAGLLGLVPAAVTLGIKIKQPSRRTTS